MRKMILSVIACVVLMLGAILAWCSYRDLLAGVLFVACVIPSATFEHGRREHERNEERRSFISDVGYECKSWL